MSSEIGTVQSVGRTLAVNLNCGGTSHRGEAALMKLTKEPWDILTGQLIKSIYGRECKR
jgi:hypothetical protein